MNPEARISVWYGPHIVPAVVVGHDDPGTLVEVSWSEMFDLPSPATRRMYVTRHVDGAWT